MLDKTESKTMLLEFQKDELLVSHIPDKVEHTKSVIDTLHDVPVPALTRMLSELNLNDNKELIYRETVLEEQLRILQVIRNTMKNYLGKLLIQF